jgi:hypothetical protein
MVSLKLAANLSSLDAVPMLKSRPVCWMLQAAVMLGILIPIFEPMGWKGHPPGTLLGYTYTWGSVLAIFISSALGLLVSLSTFLVIGATSSLTYNVVGRDS